MPAAERTALVTGSAGFIGGHLAENLLAGGWRVIGVDCLTDFYDVSRKQRTVEALSANQGFEFRESNLLSDDLLAWLERADIVFHLAGQPGVRGSWAGGFERYVDNNVVATQRLLESVRRAPVERFVFASSSSVYGDVDEYPCTESTLPRPRSPYGVTKLAAEHLCRLYAEAWGIPTVSLRLFSVYGPRQRPDMAISRLIESAFDGMPFPMYGSGEQARDFTYVSDVVAAAVLAATRDVPPGSVLNVSGGSTTTVLRLVELVEGVLDMPVLLDTQPAAHGDVGTTSGSNDLARSLLAWEPSVSLESGLALQIEWAREFHAATPTTQP